ncbi:ribonuclease HII [Candidatus Parcubacteria bacterium]|nr:ribonuclease HII [Candidatus Parcubacteria bacterium]
MINFKEEKKLRKKHKHIAGLDEAGRGPIAGPVVAAAVVVQNYPPADFPWKEIRDSKKLSAKRREVLCQLLTHHPEIEWGIGKVSEKIIDKINILQASKLAMEKAIKNLKKVDFLLLDGNFKINSKIPQKSIIKGDDKVFSIAAASIIAKVKRDAIMKKMDKKYPGYGLSKHKGYPTKHHKKMLKKHGSCKIHRQSFKPVKQD